MCFFEGPPFKFSGVQKVHLGPTPSRTPRPHPVHLGPTPSRTPRPHPLPYTLAPPPHLPLFSLQAFQSSLSFPTLWLLIVTHIHTYTHIIPFLFQSCTQEHTRFVNIIRYGPNGELFCSGGADGKAVLYDGKTGQVKGCFGGDKSHAGGIYSVSCAMQMKAASMSMCVCVVCGMWWCVHSSPGRQTAARY